MTAYRVRVNLSQLERIRAVTGVYTTPHKKFRVFGTPIGQSATLQSTASASQPLCKVRFRSGWSSSPPVHHQLLGPGILPSSGLHPVSSLRPNLIRAASLRPNLIRAGQRLIRAPSCRPGMIRDAPRMLWNCPSSRMRLLNLPGVS